MCKALKAYIAAVVSGEQEPVFVITVYQAQQDAATLSS